MHIKKIELVNFKCIKEFKEDFSGNIYFITGENELGKSSILEAIVRLLSGNRGDVLKKGEEKGSATIQVGDYTVEWKFTEKNPRGIMTIKDANGMSSDNISMLQKVFGYQDFDAAEFASWSESAEGRRKQVEAVKALLSDDVKKRLAEIDLAYKTKFDKRAEENAVVKSNKALMDKAQKELPEDQEKYAEEMKLEDLMKLQEKETELKLRYEEAKKKKDERTEQIAKIPERKTAEEERHNKEIEQIAADKKKAKEDYDALILKLDEKATKETETNKGNLKVINDEEIDFKEKLQNAEKFINKYEEANKDGNSATKLLEKAKEHNAKHELIKDFNSAKEEYEKSQKSSDALSTDLQKLLDEKAKLIKESNLPIKGLSFTDDGLELNGVAFAPDKVSDSQIMQVATALIIASNPNVKVFRIARGESLGSAKLEAIIEMAKKRGYQGFIEEVRRDQELRVEEYVEKQ